MQGTGHMAGKRRGAEVGMGGGPRAGGQAGRRKRPKTHNQNPPPTAFLFRAGRGVTTSHDHDYITSTTPNAHGTSTTSMAHPLYHFRHTALTSDTAN